ncbi:MAG: hypothetical protein M1453_00265 [Acidobacteria bacterium]|nr:hypothetical protein [Acidobacteriota bacterium]
MPMEFDLVSAGTRVEENGDGAAVDVSGSATRTFLCTMLITDQIEQESLDVSIFGSPDGTSWPAKPILKLPQRFYRGETRAVLELTLRPEFRFIRAHWDLNRWGRVAPEKMFVFGLRLAEVPAMPSRVPAEKLAAG